MFFVIWRAQRLRPANLSKTSFALLCFAFASKDRSTSMVKFSWRWDQFFQRYEPNCVQIPHIAMLKAVASPATGHWGMYPPDLQQFHFQFTLEYSLKLTAKYCAVCEISWCKYQQLTFDQYCISHKTISHRSASAPGPIVHRECPMT